MPSQLALSLDEPQRKHGGARPGAGRKRRDERTGPIEHRTREAHASRFPIHVTLRAVKGVPSFRSEKILRAFLRHVASACSRGRRLIHYSLQADHLHLIIEATDREVIARTIQGFASILARSFNRILGRNGRLWQERYHRHDLRTPTEVHHALGYVLQNFRKHAPPSELAARMAHLDPYSSAAWFDGWDEKGAQLAAALADWLAAFGVVQPTAGPRTFLLREGFRRIGLIAGDFIPPKALGARFARDRTFAR